MASAFSLSYRYNLTQNKNIFIRNMENINKSCKKFVRNRTDKSNSNIKRAELYC